MDLERRRRAQELFQRALDLPHPKRRAWVEAACGKDAELASRVLALLDDDEAEGSSLLDRDRAQVVWSVLGTGPPVPAAGFTRFNTPDR
jgi:hypothetical protein